MMREIKFRGLEQKSKKWIYGYYIVAEGFHYVFPNDIDDLFSTKVLNMDTEIIPKTIGQYTGLKDKNGKEIYEGDIVEIRFQMSLDDKPEFEIAIVKDIKNLPRMFSSSREPEVIGNIYENPELMKNE